MNKLKNQNTETVGSSTQEQPGDYQGQGGPEFKRFSETILPTKWGNFHSIVYRNHHGEEHMAVCVGLDQPSEEPTLVRVHSACFTSEVLGSLKCDCREQLEYALEAIQREGRGALIYLFQEGRGIGLGAKIQAYRLQEEGIDTVDANTQLGYAEDARRYECAVEILQDLRIERVRLLTNNPLKIIALSEFLEDIERAPIEVGLNSVNHGYLSVKKERMGHLLTTQFTGASSLNRSADSK